MLSLFMPNGGAIGGVALRDVVTGDEMTAAKTLVNAAACLSMRSMNHGEQRRCIVLKGYSPCCAPAHDDRS